MEQIINDDCLNVLKDIKDGSVDLVIADPPYYKIMTKDWKQQKHDWDNNWKNMDEYIEFIRKVGLELKRVMKPNGSLYMFADDKNAAYVQVELDKIFELDNVIIWVKPNNMTIKGWAGFRSYAPITERILFYSNEARGNNNLCNPLYAENCKVYAPLVEYMIEQKKKIKEYFKFKTNAEFNKYVNKITDTKSVVSRHYFTYSQWVFPKKEIYEKLQGINDTIFEKDFEVFKKEFVELRKEYNSMRKCFEPAENYTDVWTFNIMGGKESLGKHPTQKPIAIIKRIIKTSSRDGDLILDPFCGSGTVPVACKELGRKYICIEKEKEYYNLIMGRLNGLNK